MRARITSHGKKHVFSNDEMLPLASEGYLEDLETTEPWERKTEKQVQQEKNVKSPKKSNPSAVQCVSW